MIGPKRILFTFVVIVVCIGCDQATKSLASYQLSGSEPVGVIGKVFRLEYTENSGAMLGVGADLSEGTRFWLFTVFAACALLGILTFTIADAKLKRTDILSLSLILGGGISNLVDRLFKGGVVIDFMIVTAGPFHTAIFNLADLSIVMGLLLLAISNLPWFSRSSVPTKKG